MKRHLTSAHHVYSIIKDHNSENDSGMTSDQISKQLEDWSLPRSQTIVQKYLTTLLANGKVVRSRGPGKVPYLYKAVHHAV